MERHPVDSPETELLLRNASVDLGLSEHSWRVSSLAGDGSDRRFFRVRQGAKHFIALVAARKNASGVDENDSYFLIGQHLARHGLPVPRIAWADRSQGFFLLQDLGDVHLQPLVLRLRSQAQARHLYQRVLRLLKRLHRLAPHGFTKEFCFDTAHYDPGFILQRELEYFRRAFLLTHLGLEVAAEDLRADFEALAELAGSYRQDLVMHRDFQSRNLMVHHGDLWIIDFQGMRFGPPAYDLASLLLDPYVSLPWALQDSLVELYWAGIQQLQGGSRERFRQHYLAVRLCRNLQVLGAYGFLGRIKGKTTFLAYIPRAWSQLRTMLMGACHGWFPRLERLVKAVEESGRIAGAQRLRGQSHENTLAD
jgi:N-acetylmuramate 1-kinase